MNIEYIILIYIYIYIYVYMCVYMCTLYIYTICIVYIYIILYNILTLCKYIYIYIYIHTIEYTVENSGPVDSAECQATGAGYNRMAALRIFMRRLSAAALRGQRFSWVATASYKLVYKP